MKPSNCQCFICNTSVSMWCKHFLEICDEGHNCDGCEHPMNDCDNDPQPSIG